MGWGHPSFHGNNWNGVWQQQLWLSGAGLKLQPQGKMYFHPFCPRAPPAPYFHIAPSGSWFAQCREWMFYVWINGNSPRALKHLTLFFFGKKERKKKGSRCFEFTFLELAHCKQLLCLPGKQVTTQAVLLLVRRSALDNWVTAGNLITGALPTSSH